jgi:hypothetical protein
MPIDAGYDAVCHLACFNDNCAYYVDGWEWMRQQYRQNVSYRYRIDPATDAAFPLPVWSADALRDRIVVSEQPAPKRDRARRTATRRRGGAQKKLSKPKRRTR